MRLLHAEGLVGGYGSVDILHGVDVSVDAGELVVVVGPNGAGKSTLVRALFGLVALRRGAVRFSGTDITAAPPQRRVPAGLAYVPQERNVFPSLSVEENLEMGAFVVPGSPARRIADIYGLFPALAARRRRPARELSGGERQMVAFGRALMTAPRLLLLDEPTAGLAPRVVAELFAHVAAITRAGVGVLMVEQNARQALALADRGIVLVGGRTVKEDTGARLLADPEVAEAFLCAASGHA